MSDQSLLISLAGLLKDIGIFASRANAFPGLDASACTVAFLEKHKSIFTNSGFISDQRSLIDILSKESEISNNFYSVIHTGEEYTGGLLSSERSTTTNKANSFPNLPSVFSLLYTESSPSGTDEVWTYPLQSMGRSETIFPVKQHGTSDSAAYHKLWEGFEKEFVRLPTGSADAFLYSLFHLLKIYCWYIPVRSVSGEVKSLFEHMKMTSAMANCLFLYSLESSTQESEKKSGTEYPFMLLCGDISGIQSFIYSISNKSAMKGLKGRSFYVQLLSESISAEVLSETGVPVVNQIYAAGGKFYVLLPNTQTVQQKIEAYRQQLEKQLWGQHKGKLSVNMAGVAFRIVDDSGGRQVVMEDDPLNPCHIGQLWSSLATKTSLQKRKRFSSLIQNEFDSFFRPTGVGGNVRVCSVSGEELSSGEKALQLEDVEQDRGEGGSLAVSASVAEQIEIGKSLYDADFLIKQKQETGSAFHAGIKSGWTLENSIEVDHNKDTQIVMDWRGATVPLLPGQVQSDVKYGFRFYGGVRMATYGAKRIKTLEELCFRDDEAAETGESADRLGVLRMDVDNLGNLFMNGFKKTDNGIQVNTASFSTLATVSALLDQFFSGYLNTIRDSKEFKDHVNIVYSGGDDVFAVGRWDKLLNFAIKVRERFRRFVCDREDISISGGLALVRAKFPIAKASDIAGEMEVRAKVNVFKIDETQFSKNSLSIFGLEVNWQHEMPFIVACKNDLVRWIHVDKVISKGVLMKMFSYYNMSIRNKIEWRWQSAYMLARASRDSDNKEKRIVLNILKTLLFTENYKNEFKAVRLTAFIAACRWAELEMKNLN